MQARDDYLRLGENRVRYRDQGEGQAVVFIHGWTLDLEAWEPQAAALEGAFRVVRYDRRGFGLSDGEPGRAADAEDLGRIIERLELARPVLVGLSQGARVALAFAIANRGRLAGLVLDGPPDEVGGPETADDEDFSIAEYRALVRERGAAAFRDAWRAHPLMRLYGADPGAAGLVARMLARYPARDLVGPAVAPAPPAGGAALARLRLPVLVVNGEFDTTLRRRAGEVLVRALPDAEHVIVPGAGHLPNLDNTNAYNAAMRAFLDRRTRAAA
jgi:pimeloyl-ACP methyl ester carboxylesterase